MLVVGAAKSCAIGLNTLPPERVNRGTGEFAMAALLPSAEANTRGRRSFFIGESNLCVKCGRVV
jgi:hypothetical protein